MASDATSHPVPATFLEDPDWYKSHLSDDSFTLRITPRASATFLDREINNSTHVELWGQAAAGRYDLRLPAYNVNRSPRPIYGEFPLNPPHALPSIIFRGVEFQENPWEEMNRLGIRCPQHCKCMLEPVTRVLVPRGCKSHSNDSTPG